MTTDEALMADMRRGSREAFEAIFERYRGAMWGFYRRRLRDRARAEELVQDVFVAVLENAVRYEPRAPFRSYLFGIAFNLLKAERRRGGAAASAAEGEPAAAGTDPDTALWVRRALASLDADDREIVMLREYEGLSYQEISALLHLPLNTVRSRLFRARMDLREILTLQTPFRMKVGHESR